MLYLIKKKKSVYQAVALVLTFFLCLISVIPVLAFHIPEPTASFYVNDTAGLISQEHKDYMIAANKDLYAQTGAQVVVVTIQSLEGISVEEYSTELFRKYGIGDAKKDNGVLLLLSIDDRECRIEVGYGLEGAINDSKAGRIMDRFMIPYFRDNNWDEGLLNGFDAVLDEVCKEYNVTIDHNAPRVSVVEDTDNESDMALWGAVGIGAIGLVGGLAIGYIFPHKALIPGLLFLIAEGVISFSFLDIFNAIGAFILSVIAYIIGWAITSPEIEGSSGGYSGGSYSSSYHSSSRSSYSSRSSSSSSRSYGGGGRSGGGGASRKF